jgi:hypothetical protein
VNADEHEEISASLAAHAELGPKYDAAVAEGLVERIGQEIDRRVDERLRGLNLSQPAPGQAPTARQAHAQGQLSPGQRIVPPGYQGSWQDPEPATAPQHAPVAAAQGGVPARGASAGSTVAGTILALGSMGLGVGATAVAASNMSSAPAQAVVILLIWAVIAIINVANARRR